MCLLSFSLEKSASLIYCYSLSVSADDYKFYRLNEEDVSELQVCAAYYELLQSVLHDLPECDCECFRCDTGSEELV